MAMMAWIGWLSAGILSVLGSMANQREQVDRLRLEWESLMERREQDINEAFKVKSPSQNTTESMGGFMAIELLLGIVVSGVLLAAVTGMGWGLYRYNQKSMGDYVLRYQLLMAQIRICEDVCVAKQWSLVSPTVLIMDHGVRYEWSNRRWLRISEISQSLLDPPVTTIKWWATRNELGWSIWANGREWKGGCRSCTL